MVDSVKAANNLNFKVTKDQLMSIVEGYRKRTYIEDINIITQELKGEQGLLDALNVDVETGISSTSLSAREQVFGTNHKDPPTRTGFCNMVLAALDDLMLKVLIVCAFLSIAIEMSFNAGNPEKLKTAWIEGFAILCAVACVSLVSAWSDYKKEGQFMAQQMLEEDGKIVSNKNK